jgi:CheY-like chemotaxis protein
VAAALKDGGFDPVIASTGKQALFTLKEAADIDLVLLDYEIADPRLPDVLVQLRSDLDTAMLPILVTVPPTPEGRRAPENVIPLARLVAQFRNLQIIQATNDPDLLRKLIPPRLEESLGQPFTEDERKAMALQSLAWLRRLATGEVAGYDVRNAESAILKVLRSDDLGVLAAEAAGRLPSREAQRELAAVILDQNVKDEVRVAAAAHLVRSIQINSLVLGGTLSRAIEELHQKTKDPSLKTNLSLVVGAMRPDAVKTAQRIQGYSPIGGAAPAPAPEMKKEEMKKEEMKKEEKKEER